MKDRASVLLLLPDLSSTGGIQQHSRNLISAFTASGATVQVLALHGPREQTTGTWRSCGSNRWAFVWGAVSALRLRPKIVLFGHRGFLPLVLPVRVLAHSTRLWLAAYGIEVESAFGVCERLALGHVERVLAISPWTCDLVKQVGFRGSIDLVPCALPPGARPADDAPPKLASPLRLLTVTRLSAAEGYKGIDTTIEALARLGASGVRAELRVVGEGDDRARLEALAVARGVGTQVAFLGRVDEAQRESEYASCDIFVLPSTREGFGLAFLEAMLHARPVVACDAAGAPFVVRPGVCGMLARPGDAAHLTEQIALMARDPGWARSLGRQGQELALTEFAFHGLVARLGGLVAASPRSALG